MRIMFLFVFAFLHAITFAATPPLWGNLKPGPHPVGFTARFEYDYSRTFRPKVDLDGKQVTGIRARPIQIAIWYPASKGSDPAMKYEDYAFLVAQELEFGPVTKQVQELGRQQFVQQRQRFSRATDAAIQHLLQSNTAAVKDAPAAGGKFPLIVYAPGSSGTAVENPVLCEFLASHGYVVAALPSMGAYSRIASVDLTGFYAYMQDIEFVIGKMHHFPSVNPDALALVGFSMGGGASTLVQMRNFDVDAAVYLDTGLIFPLVETWFRPSNYYNPTDLRAPQLYLTRADAPDINLNFLDLMPYADRYSLLFHGGYRHVDFISDGIFTGIIPGYQPENVKNAQKLFEFISEFSLQFLNGYVKKDSAALALLKRTPQQWGVTTDFVTTDFASAEIGPPRESEFVNLLRQEQFDRAKAIYDQMKMKNPKLTMFREDVLNALGYEYLFRGNRDLAVKILSLNADAYPRSANAMDSLSEAYESMGEKERALEFAQKGLTLLPHDSSMNDRRREIVRKLLEERIKKLNGVS